MVAIAMNPETVVGVTAAIVKTELVGWSLRDDGMVSVSTMLYSLVAGPALEHIASSMGDGSLIFGYMSGTPPSKLL
jgi:hypothetical protein